MLGLKWFKKAIVFMWLPWQSKVAECTHDITRMRHVEPTQHHVAQSRGVYVFMCNAQGVWQKPKAPKFDLDESDS